MREKLVSATTAARSLGENVAFRRLFTGRVVTNAGDSLYLIATMWLVHELSGSTFYTGLAGFLVRLPETLQFLAGPLVDRWNVNRILVWTQIIQSVLVLGVPVAAAFGYLNVTLVLVLVPVLMLLNQFVYPAQNVALPRLVDDDEIVNANTAFSFAYRGVDMTFNAIGGIVISVIGAVSVYVLDSVTFLVAALLFALVNVPQNDSDDANVDVTGYVRDVTEGFSYIRRSLLAYVVASAVITNFALGMTYAILPAFSDTFLGGSGAYGTMLAAMAGGSLAGALGASAFKDRPFGRLVVGSFLLASVSWIGASVLTWLPATVVLFGLAWIPIGAFNVMVQTICQTAVPDDLLGRVTSALISVGAIASPVGSLVGGAAGTIFGSRVVLSAAGLGLLSIASFFALSASLRTFPPVEESSRQTIET